MTVTIDLRPEIEANLTALAAERGISLAQYVVSLLEKTISGLAPTELSPAQRAAAWREATADLPHTPPLSDEAISRERLYDVRE